MGWIMRSVPCVAAAGMNRAQAMLIIPSRFSSEVHQHLALNYATLEGQPLILGIFGQPGEGKTFSFGHCSQMLQSISFQSVLRTWKVTEPVSRENLSSQSTSRQPTLLSRGRRRPW